MSIIRVKPDVACSVYDDETDTRIALVPGLEFDSHDPIVKKFGWAFQTDSDADGDTERKARKRTTSVRVEEATANPGEKRNR